MKKVFCLLSLALLCPAAADAAEDAGDFYQNLLVTDEVIAAENEDIAIENARRMLDSKPKILKMKDNKVVRLPNRDAVKTPAAAAEPAAAEPAQPEYGSAPFGLVWGASAKEIENLGVTLTPAGEKDYMNNYIAGHLPNSLHDFRDVMLTFGIDNRLWRIIAYGKFIKDDAAASGVLKMYRGYFKLLSQKYGHAQEFYTPNVVNVDKTVTDTRGKPQTVTEEKKQPIGNPDFLKELQNGDAELYATFENGIVGAALGVNVDGNGQSYITIDYKNLKLMKEREAETLNAL